VPSLYSIVADESVQNHPRGPEDKDADVLGMHPIKPQGINISDMIEHLLLLSYTPPSLMGGEPVVDQSESGIIFLTIYHGKLNTLEESDDGVDGMDGL